MNRHRYRLIRNRRTALWTPVPEIARGQGKGKARAALSLVSMAFSSLAAAASALPVPCAPGACGSNPSVPGFVSQGAAAYGTSGNRGVVSQVGNKAILNWQNFNVGRGNTVTFQQVQDLVAKNPVAGANFSTLNRIWQADPSVIAGAINVTGGQKGNLTFINQNGIVFTGTAQVDVNTLTASSLNMPDKFFMGALTPFGNAEAQFEGSGGFVSVLDGARISAANGGRVMLLAPTVTNRGRIETPDGQTILAAGTKVYLSASQDSNLRGFLVEVDSPAGLSNAATPNTGVPATVSLDGVNYPVSDAYSLLGNATNTGTVQVGTGNATMVGYAVNQMGVVSATNSVVLGGSVYLTAKDTKKNLLEGVTVTGFSSTRAGEVKIGDNSRTAVMPALDENKVQAALASGMLSREVLDRYLAGDAPAADFISYMSDTTSLDSQTFSGGQVRIVGQDVRLGNGSLVRAPAGGVSIYAVDDPSKLGIYDPLAADLFATAGSAISTSARVQLGAGSRIDVSGLEAVPVSVARNSVEIRLQGDELKDSSVNRDGAIRGEKVWVDVTRGSALIANVSDYQGQIGRGIAERSTDAGVISLRSQGDVSVEGGAILDVSGGYVDYTAAATKRTLLATNGKLVDIADAKADVKYDGVASRVEIVDPRWGVTRVFGVGENRYSPGYREGKDAGTVEILSRRVALDGTAVGHTVVGEFQVKDAPAGAALKIGASLGSASARDHFLMQSVVIGDPAAMSTSDTLIMPTRLFGGDGINRLELYSNNPVTVNNAIRVAPGGSVRLTGEGVSVNATIEAPAGSISIAARENQSTLPSDALDIRIAGGVNLDVSGRWINDAVAGVAGLEPRAINAGSITLSAVENLVLGAASHLNLGGGAYKDVKNKITGGNAGNLALEFLQLLPEIAGAAVPLEQHIDSAGPGKGGTLSLSAERVEIGPFDANASGALRLDAGFFKQGFGSYSVTGLTGLEVLPASRIVVRTSNREFLPASVTAPTGTDVRAISVIAERPDNLRRAASVSLKSGVYLGQTSTLELGAESLLAVDAGARVSLAASGRINLKGAVSAPAGSISATLEKDIGAFAYNASDAIVLDAGSSLSVAGASRVFPDARGLRKGDVLPGGTITLNAVTGYLYADVDATLDISGAAPVAIDQPNAQGGFGISVASDAGRLSVSAREGMVLDAALRAQGGGTQARGGAFELVLGSNTPPGANPYPSSVRRVEVGGTSPGMPADFNVLSGRAYVDLSRLEGAGVDAISLTSLDTIRFQSDVTLGGNRAVPLGAIRLNAPQIDVNGRTVVLSASNIELGNLDPERQSPVAVAPAGSGSFAADAGFLELAGKSTWNGAARLQFSSDSELRLTGVSASGTPGRPAGALNTAAEVALSAGVVSPSTLTEFVVSTTGDLSVSRRGTAMDPLSAMGAITIQAANISQGGNIQAPFGRITLDADDRLTLLDGSATSVAGNAGMTPYGMTVNGRTWTYDYGSRSQTISALDSKTVSLKGQSVNMHPGSTVNFSGGGDLQAWEFTPGPGGSVDVLAESGAYAILPGYRGPAIPGDPQNAAGFDRATGTAVWLDNAPGLGAGVYTLLPAHYALLPGAYMIRVSGAAKDVLPGKSSVNMDGSMLVSGYLTDARHAAGGPREGRYSGYTLLPQAEVLRRSEFSLTSASSFFADAATGRPGDAGSLVIDAAQTLNLQSNFVSSSMPGFRGAQVDITAPKIAVVSNGGAASPGNDFLRLEAAQLNSLNAASLLLGGTRSATAEGVEIKVGARQVVVANSEATPLTGPDLLFVASESLTVKPGAIIEGKGAQGGDLPPTMVVGSATVAGSGNGALLRVSAGKQAPLERRGVNRAAETGIITIEGAQLPEEGGREAAVLRAEGALRIDATHETTINGELKLDAGGALALGASRVSMGETDGVTSGLILSNERLAALGKPADFAVRSYSTFDLYGNAVLGDPLASTDRIRALTIEAAGINGHINTGKTAVVSADTITLGNPDNTAFIGATLPGDGALRFSAQTIRLGSGGSEITPFEIRGFSSTTMAASRELVAQGKAGLVSAMPLSVETTRMTTAAGADATIKVVSGALTTLAPVVAAGDLGVAGLGGKLVMTAPTIVHGTHIEMPSGVVQLNATGVAGADGVGSVSLMPGSSVSVAGTEMQFFDVSRYTTGGTVTLSSQNADVRVNAGARVVVSGAPGADAGTLAVYAVQGTAQIDGALLGTGAASAGVVPRQGSFILDVATLSDFNQLNQLLEPSASGNQVIAGGFTESRDIRIRNGNVAIGSATDAETTVTARTLQLSADTGRIDVFGQIDARGDKGGSVSLYTGSGITLHPNSGIAARAAAADAAGGSVMLSTAAGSLDIAPDALIDVSPGTQGNAGVLHLRAPRTAGNNSLDISRFAGTVTGAGVIRAEGFRSYDDASIASTDFAATAVWFTEARDFMANSEIIKGALGVAGDDRFRVMPGIEIRSTSTPGSVVNQTLAADWSLHAWRYDPDTGDVVTAPAQLASGLNAAGKPLVAGVLTLRSTGALNFNGSLSDGFNGATTVAVLQGLDSWSYRLIAGADLSAANPLTVLPGTSDVSLANGKLIRTGTGSIDIAAGDAIRLGNLQSVIYTAGRLVDAADRSGFVAMPVDTTGTGASASDYLFTRDGGDIRLSAVGDIEMVTTPLSNVRQLYSNWLYRQGQVDDGTGEFDVTFTNGIQLNPQTAWWVRFEQFQQGVGALGGGHVTASAGGSLRNVSLSSATQGYMNGTRPDASDLKILGTGDVRVKTGGDLLGGQFWSGNGNVELDIGGSLGFWTIPTANANTLRKLFPIVALSDGKADIRARGDIELHGVIDPFLVVQERGAGKNFTSIVDGSAGLSRWTLFSSQNERTAAAVSSLNGNVRIYNPESTSSSAVNAIGVQQAFSSLNTSGNWSSNLYSGSNRPLSLAPASLSLTAYQGDIEIQNTLIQRPAGTAALEFYAGRNVSIPGTVVMSDMNVARVPVAMGIPGKDTQDLPSATLNWRSHAETTPVHAEDTEPMRIYAAGGAITGRGNTTSLILAKSARIQAATNITDLGVEAQNLRDSDVTAVRAGNDIRYTNSGSRARNAVIKVGGPGLVEIEAGRNIDLGASEGIVTRGDLDNPALPAGGAAINVAVGVKSGVDYQGAIERIITALEAATGAGSILDDSTLWQVRWLTGNNAISDVATALSAVRAVDSLPDAAQRLRVRSMYFQALRDTGRDYNDPASPYSGEYTRGYKTVELLFPTLDSEGKAQRYEGELNLFASRIRTERGGDIEFMVPGGQAVIGVAQLPDNLAFYNPASPSAAPGTPGSVNRNPVALGMVTVEKGAIRGFTQDDVLVNQSRILTVGGGDIVLWSSEADIDAGKGKRTVTSVPPPVIKFDSSGNVTVELQGVATGSGIGALAGQPGVVAGDVDLIAPKGAVNAGEAGIRATNLNIAAQFILNSQNIQVSGATTGAPVADSSGLTSGLAGNTVADQGQDAARALGNQSAEAKKTADEVRRALAAFNLISVEVLGFGEQ